MSQAHLGRLNALMPFTCDSFERPWQRDTRLGKFILMFARSRMSRFRLSHLARIGAAAFWI
jgi:hypothetical protein